MRSFSIMSVLGIAEIFFVPYMLGYILKTMTKNRETGRIGMIEIYLTGFFFLFLLQGLVFSPAYLIFGMELEGIIVCYKIMLIAVLILFTIAVVLSLTVLRDEPREERYRQKLKKEEGVLLGIMIVVAVLICIRTVGIIDYVRDDFMLPMVRTTIDTGTINTYNPVTSRAYVYGIINSRKVITLPLYYACVCSVFGLDEIIALYIMCTIRTIICTYFSCVLFMSIFTRIRERLFVFCIFLGGLILSGDYFNRAIGTKLMWNGYAGDTIVASVMLPYVIYAVFTGYRDRKMTVGSLLRLLLVLTASVFITSVARGAVLIMITAIVTYISCIITGKSDRPQNDAALIVEE